LDLVSEFGHQSGGMVSYAATVTDGVLDIGFLHVVENPLVNAIEVMQSTDTDVSLVISTNDNFSKKETDLIVYPSPISSGQSLNIILPHYLTGENNVSLSLFQSNGKKVFVKEYSRPNSQLAIPLYNLNSGVYLLQISNGNDFNKVHRILVK
ncbi:T9SS type A sorting domain-containing protein, partial [Croceivirga thetidis]